MTTDQPIDKKAVISGLKEMLYEPVPLRIGTLKALVLESLDVINQLIEKGWSYEDIAKRIQSNGVQIKGSTLRRYVSDVQPKVGKKRGTARALPVQEKLPNEKKSLSFRSATQAEKSSETEQKSTSVSTTSQPTTFE